MQFGSDHQQISARVKPVIIRTPAGRLARSVLPTRLEAERARLDDGQTILTFGLQRCGQHAVIAWICHCFGEALHFNHCRFVRRGLTYVLAPAGGRRIIYRDGVIDDARVEPPCVLRHRLGRRRFQHVLYSLEDPDLTEPQIRRVALRPRTRCVLIVRDPYNWLASAMRSESAHMERLHTKVSLYKQHLRQALGCAATLGREIITVDFGKFIAHPDYRRSLAASLGTSVTTAAEESLDQVQLFGGGSSFTGTALEEGHRNKVQIRWQVYTDDPAYREILNDPELRRMTAKIFADLPHISAAERALRS